MRRTCGIILALLEALNVGWAAQNTFPKVIYIPFVDARSVLESEADLLPAEMKGRPVDRLEATWSGWIEHRDREIRARLAQGEEDTIVNFVLFGTSFTRQPRVTADYWERLQKQEQADSYQREKSRGLEEMLSARLNDLVMGAAYPGENERLWFVRGVLARRGYNLGTTAGRTQAELYLRRSLSRVLKESAGYAGVLQAARSLGDATEEFVQRSTLFQMRGLSLDTSWPVNFALEDSLASMKVQGLLAEKSVHRVAIIGPGLDFTDKQEGYDFYPQQTIQPFAVFDSLLRLGLAGRNSLRVTTLDISRRVNEHLEHARERARTDKPYIIQLALDPAAKWTSDAVHYWERIGGRIGAPAKAAPVPPALATLRVRAVRIRPATVERVTPVDLNIVLQRMVLRPTERFDLIIATNIFVYYDTFEQTLALTNVSHMLKPGGFLLSNNALLELPSSVTRSVGYRTTVYSDRPGDGDHMIWYKRFEDDR